MTGNYVINKEFSGQPTISLMQMASVCLENCEGCDTVVFEIAITLYSCSRGNRRMKMIKRTKLPRAMNEKIIIRERLEPDSSDKL